MPDGSRFTHPATQEMKLLLAEKYQTQALWRYERGEETGSEDARTAAIADIRRAQELRGEVGDA